MKPLSAFFLFIFVASILSSCGSGDKPGTKAADKSSAAEPTQYRAAGTVISLPPGKRNIVIKHGDIPGFMNAMTMPFTLKDSMQTVGITTGDSIRFKIIHTVNRVYINEIEKIE